MKSVSFLPTPQRKFKPIHPAVKLSPCVHSSLSLLGAGRAWSIIRSLALTARFHRCTLSLLLSLRLTSRTSSLARTIWSLRRLRVLLYTSWRTSTTTAWNGGLLGFLLVVGQRRSASGQAAWNRLWLGDLNGLILLDDDEGDLLDVDRANLELVLKFLHLGVNFLELLGCVLGGDFIAAGNEPAVDFVGEKDDVLGVVNSENE